jgi:hypothetical protein
VGVGREGGRSRICCTLNADQGISGSTLNTSGNGRENSTATVGDGTQHSKLDGDYQITVIDQTGVKCAGSCTGILKHIQETALIDTAGRIVAANLLIARLLNAHATGVQCISRRFGHKSIHSIAALCNNTGNLATVKTQEKFNSI